MNTRFEVFTAASMKLSVVWDIAPCSLVGVDWRFRGVYCLHYQGDQHYHLWKQWVRLKRRSVSPRLYGATSQKSVVLILAGMRTQNFTKNFVTLYFLTWKSINFPVSLLFINQIFCWDFTLNSEIFFYLCDCPCDLLFIWKWFICYSWCRNLKSLCFFRFFPHITNGTLIQLYTCRNMFGCVHRIYFGNLFPFPSCNIL
jgi:hypothetical protein